MTVPAPTTQYRATSPHRSTHSLGAVLLVKEEPIDSIEEAELASGRPYAQLDREQLRCKQQHTGSYARSGKSGCARGFCDTPSPSNDALLRYGDCLWVTYATSVPAINVLVHLGGQCKPANTYQPIG